MSPIFFRALAFFEIGGAWKRTFAIFYFFSGSRKNVNYFLKRAERCELLRFQRWLFQRWLFFNVEISDDTFFNVEFFRSIKFSTMNFSTLNLSTLKVFDYDFSNVEFFNVEFFNAESFRRWFFQRWIFRASKTFFGALLFLASNISLAFTLHLSKEIDASRIFGARKMFCWRAVDFSFR